MNSTDKNKLPLKVLILGDLSNSHLIKWANSLIEEGIDLSLFTLSKFSKDDYDKRIKIYSFPFSEKVKSGIVGSFTKSFYLLSIFRLKRIISEIKPDILHAHYASSYGLLGALAGRKPFFLSVWGIDITIFPNKNILTRALLKYVLYKADKIFTTSSYLARETSNYTKKEMNIIPFGVDTNKFKLIKYKKDKNLITLGTVKPLENKYGLEFLIKIFAEIKKEISNKNLRLFIVGGGSLESKLKNLVKSLNIENDTHFTGKVNHSDIHLYHNKLDIAVYLSDYESFGVSVLESMACEKPVVVSDVGGLPELVTDNYNGYVVKRGEKTAAINAFKELIIDEEKRIGFGKLGRQLVVDKYQWEKSIELMMSYYLEISKES